MKWFNLLLIVLISLLLGYISAQVYSNYTNKRDSSQEPVSTKVLSEGNKIPNIYIFNDNGRAINFLEIEPINKKENIFFIYTIGCNTCVSEAKEFTRLFERHKSKYNFFGIARTSSYESMLNFKLKYNLNFESYIIDSFNIKKLNILKYPSIIISNKQGEVLFFEQGPAVIDSLKSFI